MTTIAYKDGIIAYDSRITGNGRIDYDDYEKCHEAKGVRFFLSGFTCDYAALIDAWFGEPVAKDVDASALVVEGENIWLASCNPKDGLWKSPVLPDRPYAIGSGADFAIAVMDMGATAYQAVEVAAKRDTSTGGIIRTYTLAKG